MNIFFRLTQKKLDKDMTGLNQICNYLRDRIQIFVTPLQT